MASPRGRVEPCPMHTAFLTACPDCATRLRDWFEADPPPNLMQPCPCGSRGVYIIGGTAVCPAHAAEIVTGEPNAEEALLADPERTGASAPEAAEGALWRAEADA